MEIISKISKGSKMDQIYIPKNRSGFGIGSYVVLKPLEVKKIVEKPYFYNVNFIEPIKLELINEIFDIIDNEINYKNIVITGSFLDEGFNFNDIDVLIISEDKLSEKDVQKQIFEKLKIKTHVIIINNKTLIRGLSTDPLYQMMLSKCIAKKRFVYKLKHKIDYKILDLHLLKSQLLIDNFDYLNGTEKYYLIRNMVSIYLYSQNKKINKENVDKEIKSTFDLEDVKEIKLNMLDKTKFLKKYKSFCNKFAKKIIKNAAKQKKTD